MDRLAFTVSSTFIIRNLGLMVCPTAGQLEHGLQIGNRIELERPDGINILVTVDCLSPVHANPTPFFAPVFSSLVENDVLIGTRVWVIGQEGNNSNPAVTATMPKG